MSDTDEETLIVTLSGSHSLGEVTTSLAARGFKVSNVLKEIGVVTGTASAGAMDALRMVPGVADVSKDHEVHTM
jgi:hypothetical protein